MDSSFTFPGNNQCRTCLSSSEPMTSLFNVIDTGQGETESLSAIFSWFTEIQICENDSYPCIICDVCLQKLTEAYTFRLTCRETNEKLKQIYDNNYSQSYYTLVKFIPQSESTPSLEESQSISSDNDDKLSKFGIGTEEIPSLIVTVNNYVCAICARKFYNKYSLNRHKKVHSTAYKSQLKCNICHKEFTRTNDVKRHMLTHTGERPFACVLCKMSFNQSGPLRIHMRKTHGHTSTTLKHKDNGRKKHLCFVCGKSFKESGSLTIHIRRHSGDKPYHCKICNMSFVSSGRLTTHMRVHTGERPFSCNVCGKKFAQSSVIAKHMKSHTGDKPYTCEICSKSFTTFYSLKIHQRMHTGEKPHICSVCHKAFADPKNLKNHLTIHSSIKPHICGICGKGFRRNHHLKSHLNVHTRDND